MRTIRSYAIQVSATVAVLGFLAGIAVLASTSGWLPFDWFVGDVNPNRLGMNKEPFLPSELGMWVTGIGMLCFCIGLLIVAWLAAGEVDEQDAVADRP